MNYKQKVFVEAYLKSWNATEAARVAGYKYPNKQGPRLLVNDGIQDAIKARISEMVMSADEVLVRLAEQARGSMADFVSVDPVLAEEEGSQDQYTVDLARAQELGKLHLIKKISLKQNGLTIELYDSQAALKLIGQHHKLFSMRHSLDIEKDSKLEEWLSALAGARKNDEVAEPGAENGDLPPDGARSESPPGKAAS